MFPIRRGSARGLLIDVIAPRVVEAEELGLRALCGLLVWKQGLPAL